MPLCTPLHDCILFLAEFVLLLCSSEVSGRLLNTNTVQVPFQSLPTQSVMGTRTIATCNVGKTGHAGAGAGGVSKYEHFPILELNWNTHWWFDSRHYRERVPTLHDRLSGTNVVNIRIGIGIRSKCSHRRWNRGRGTGAQHLVPPPPSPALKSGRSAVTGCSLRSLPR